MSGDYIETGLEGDLFTIAFSTFVFWYITKTLGQRRNDWYPNYLLRVMKTGKHLIRKTNVKIFVSSRKQLHVHRNNETLRIDKLISACMFV